MSAKSSGIASGNGAPNTAIDEEKTTPRPIIVSGDADRFKERTRAVEVDVHALLEINLGFARYNRREMEDHVRPAGDCRACGGRISNVGTDGLDRARRISRAVAGRSRRGG